MHLCGGSEVGEERLQLGHVRGELLEEGIEVVQHGAEVFEQRHGQVEVLLRVRQPSLGCSRKRAERAEKAVELRRERLRRRQQRRERALRRLEFFEERRGDDGELVDFFERHRRAALERRQRAPRVGPGLALFGCRMEGVFPVHDQAFQLPVASRQRVEDDARVVDHGAQRAFLGGEDADERVGVFGERLQVGQRGVDFFAAPVDAFRERLLPDFPGRARLRVERFQNSVERDRAFDLAVGQLAVIRQVASGAALRDQLHVGLAQQRLLAQDRVHVRADRRVAPGDLERRVRAAFLVVLDRHHMPDVHAADAHVGLFGQSQALREGDRHAVPLRLQRHGPTERLPQEQQQAEAAQREQDDHEHVPERGRALLHLSARSSRACRVSRLRGRGGLRRRAWRGRLGGRGLPADALLGEPR